MIRTLAFLAAFSFVCSTHAQAPRSPTPQPVEPPFRTTVFAEGLVHPWGLAVLPDGRFLVTERPGRMRIVGRNGELSEPLAGVPEVLAQGQGGLLDVALDPAFRKNRRVYFSYAEPGEGGAGTAVARARLGEGRLENVEIIWRQLPKVRGANHFGSRLVFARDRTLFVTTGERFDYKEEAQDLSNTLGTVVRIRRDGSVPPDNPFVRDSGRHHDIWSYGHRNIQSAALHPASGELWIVEHGPRGGDELQRAAAGRNYGWPVISYGVNYDGTPVGDGETAREGMEQPLFYWDPVIAPSGALFYTAAAIPEWRGDLLVGSLRPGGLVRLRLDGTRVAEETRYRSGLLDTRIRALAQGNDGFVYAATDQTRGRILRLAPGK